MIVNVGEWAHSVSDHTQGNWNGIVGRIELSATSPVWLEDVQVYPNISQKSALVKVRIGNDTAESGQGTLTVNDKKLPVQWQQKGGPRRVGNPARCKRPNLGRVQPRPAATCRASRWRARS